MNIETLTEYVRKNYVLATVILVAVAWVLYQIRFLIAIFFVSFLIVIGFLPITRYLRKKGWNNVVAVLIPYAAAAGLVVLIIAPFFFKVASEFQNLINTLTMYWEKLPQLFSVEGVSVLDLQQAIRSRIDSFISSLFTFTGAAVSVVAAISTTITMSIYAQIDYDRIRAALLSSVRQYVSDADRVYERLEKDLGAWVGGQVTLCAIIGGMSWLILTILGIPFATSLAFLAGLFELLPTIGPILAAIPAILIGLEQSFTSGMLVMIAYIGIQFLENSVIVPRVMGKAVNLHALVIIPALVVGYQFLGIVGAVLAIPALVTLRILWSGIPRRNSANNE